LDYWTWAQVSIPLQNYIAWFVIAALSAGAYGLMHKKAAEMPRVAESWLVSYYVGIQVVFFAVLQLFGGN
jgi:putative membrane protein